MKRIAFFIPDGVGIRNYLFSDVVKNIVESGSELVFITSISKKAIKEVEDIHKTNFDVIDIPKYTEGVMERFLRELENISRLRLFSHKLKNSTIIPNAWRSLSKYHGATFWFYFIVKYFSFLIFNYSLIKLVNKLYLSQVRSSAYFANYEKLIAQMKLDVVLCTHQRAIIASPLFEAAKKAGVRTVTAIYSWDNLPKARMAFRADQYLVWSDYMKDEMRFYYPEIPESSVLITGTPQFEFYTKEALLLTRNQFCEKYGFNNSRPIICYSGGDVLTSPYDQLYLADLAEELLKIPIVNRPQILFRRCPVDWSDRFNEVLKKYNDIVSVDPLWSFEEDEHHKWVFTFPLFDDVKLLVNVAYHCDVVYNVGSTMAHDYTMYNKPACYVNYNPIGANGGYSIERIYKYQHFRSMPSANSVVWVNSKETVAKLVAEAISQPNDVAVDRNAWLQKVIKHPVNQASLNISNILLST
jgi:hypothetical protein